jgi:hypothetical protein
MASDDIGPMIPVTAAGDTLYRAMYNNTGAAISISVTVEPKGSAPVTDTIALQPYQQIAFTFKVQATPPSGLWCYPIMG